MDCKITEILAKTLKKGKDLGKEETRFLNTVFDNYREEIRKVEKAKRKSKGR